MALRHHERNFATRSAHTLEAFRTRRQVSKTSVSYETSSKSHTSSLQNERFVRDFLQKSHVKSAKRAFRSRHPPKVTRQVSKTSVSYETSSKTHMSKSAKRALRTRLPPKVKRKHPSEHTHHAALPSSFAIPAPPNNTRSHGSHANANVTATVTSTTTHNLTIPCACQESFHVHTSNAHKVLHLHLPRKSHFHTSKPAQSTAPATKSDHIISCELQQNLHHTTRLECSEHTPIQKHHSPNANPNGAAQKTADLTKRCACTVNSTSTLRHLTFPRRFHAISHESDTSRFHPKPSPKASPNSSALALYCGRLRTVADGCERLRTVANIETTGRKQGSTPRTPRVKREPFATHSGKTSLDRSSQ